MKPLVINPVINNDNVVTETDPAASGRGLGELTVSLTQGVAVYTLTNFGVRGLSFLLFPLYTHFLAPSEYGSISLAQAIAAVVAVLGGLGLTGGVARLYFQHADDAAVLRRYLSSIFY